MTTKLTITMKAEGDDAKQVANGINSAVHSLYYSGNLIEAKINREAGTARLVFESQQPDPDASATAA